ncbi:MAG: glycogen synthase [Bacteroidetes bacterium RIFOXYA12_FULL_35_11]|nr:MAG: glycogen synthase [Bacteroidetes bacterium GWF2_35_48]OFY75913.1 MAG: glycogen synthase [Bacteroidetes bacterium RIFOXYA12_FULL_35_11]HBX52146.1 glycogen synthase [Bacteroidales bacterium]
MEKSKILFISQEITPYLPETEMSVVGRYLPQGIQEGGREIRTFMPRYGCVNERRNQLHEVIRLSGMNLIIDDTDHPLIIKVASIQSARMQVYFIDNEDYFQRKFQMVDDDGVAFPDNDERMIFFARGVIETVKKLRWVPDVVHCLGYMSSLVPLYLKRTFAEDPLFNNSKVVYSIYNEEHDLTLAKTFKNKVMAEGITKKDLEVVNTPDYLNICKLAINMSDGVIYGTSKIHPSLKKHVESLDKPVLTYQSEETYIKAYSEFYDKVLSESLVESY